MTGITQSTRMQLTGFTLALGRAAPTMTLPEAMALLALARALKAAQRDEKYDDIIKLQNRAHEIVTPYGYFVTLEDRDLVIYGENLHLQVPTV